MKAKIFISFCWDDIELCQIVQKILGSSPLLECIVVTNKATPAQLLTKKVSDSIEKSEFFVPILTANSRSNQWVNQEIGYAKALGREMFPIVENRIMSDLKGFIHNQNDLPFNFVRENSHSDFKSLVELLKQTIEKTHCVSTNFIQNFVFNGTWQNTYTDKINPAFSGEEKFCICNGKEYHVIRGNKKEHVFDLADIDIDIANKKILFTKVGINNDTRIVPNVLSYDSELGYRYTGSEAGERTLVQYVRIL